MTINDNLSEFAGHKIEDWDPETGLEDPEIAYRVRIDYDQSEEGVQVADLLGQMLDDKNAPKLKALVIGCWNMDSSANCEPIVEILASAGARLASLEALFLGDIQMEEQEISWIQQCDISPLFTGLPKLKVLRVRGSDGLNVGAIRHANLEELAFESGGLPRRIVEAVMKAELPKLRHLELWLGDSNYGYDASIDAMEPLLSGKQFPGLRYLGLKDCEDQDEIAQAVAKAPILDKLEVLDLSMGTLSDEGAQALLDSPSLGKLKKLDIHHHYVSEELVKQLEAKVKQVDAGDAEGADTDEDDRYVAVAE